MRTLYEPATILLSVAAAATLAGGVIQGRALEASAEADASQLELEASQEAVALRREKRDAEIAKEGDLSRKRALFAAQGGSTSGNAFAILQSSRAEFDIGITRLIADSKLRRKSLLAQAANVRAGGKLQRTAAIFGGVANAAKTGVPIFSSAPPAISPAPPATPKK